jgi:hypothetical protein
MEARVALVPNVLWAKLKRSASRDTSGSLHPQCAQGIYGRGAMRRKKRGHQCGHGDASKCNKDCQRVAGAHHSEMVSHRILAWQVAIHEGLVDDHHFGGSDGIGIYKPQPSIVAAVTRITLSANICRKRAGLLAPSAWRKQNSGDLWAFLARSSMTTLAHAINNTSATMLIRNRNGWS